MSAQAPVLGARQFTMAELVERTGVSPATVRFYLSEGLLPEPIKVAVNRYLYDERHVEVIRLIRILRERRGLSLEEIGRLLPDALPDLLGRPDGGVFRPDMWQVLSLDVAPTTTSTSERLVERALLAFAERGYAEVTIDEICREVAIAKGSFYRYFSSKEELFFAVARRAGKTVGERIADATPMFGDLFALKEAARGALEPYLVVVLDLSSFAIRHRPGYAAALGAFFADVRDGLQRVADPTFVESIIDDVVGHSIVAATAK